MRWTSTICDTQCRRTRNTNKTSSCYWQRIWTLNIHKTKVMIKSNRTNINVPFHVEIPPLQWVQIISYVGCTLNEFWNHSNEQKIRIKILELPSCVWRVLFSMSFNIKNSVTTYSQTLLQCRGMDFNGKHLQMPEIIWTVVLSAHVDNLLDPST